jgi:putative transposase
MIPIARQCELLGVNRSGFYYRSKGESDYNLTLMRLIDEQYTATPFYGVPRMTVWLKRQGHPVNRKRVARLMRKMGLQAIYPKPKLSRKDADHRIYPYILRGVKIVAPNQVWSADITYIRLRQGFLYLTAVMDWFSRYVLSWQLSNSLDSLFCIEALQTALASGRPAIFNTDQGVQFTSCDFVRVLEAAGIQISMDGRGRALDNVFVERLWRSVKYEEVYLHDYATPGEARLNLDRYFRFYNEQRYHQALDYRTPGEVYSMSKNEFSRHGEVYPSIGGDGRGWGAENLSLRLPYRSDKLPPVYPSAGCTPAEPASVSTGESKIIKRKLKGNVIKNHLNSGKILSSEWG